jgi:hypothetical protein
MKIGVKMDYAAVSQACKRFEEKTQLDKSVLNLKTAVEDDLKRKSGKKG